MRGFYRGRAKKVTGLPGFSRADYLPLHKAAQRLSVEEETLRVVTQMVVPYRARHRGPWLYAIADLKAALDRRGITFTDVAA
jgi:hypothetical protein